MTGRDAVIQFNNTVGRLAEAALTSSGRAMIQSALRTQQPEIVAICLAEIIAGLPTVACDVNGCHVLRSLIEVLSEQQADAFAAAMPESVVLELGTHALATRRILETLFERHHEHSANHLQPIVDILASNAAYLAQTQQGCLTLNKVFDRGTDAQKHSVVEALLPKFSALAMDKYGNYVVQNVLVNSNPVTRAQYVLQGMTGHFVALAKNKFSSNAVENVVRNCTAPVRAAVVKELFQSEAVLENVAEDQFGNFVLQTIVANTTDAEEYKMIESMVRAILPRTPFAKRLESRLFAAQQVVRSLSEGGINNGNKSVVTAPLPHSAAAAAVAAVASSPVTGSSSTKCNSVKRV